MTTAGSEAAEGAAAVDPIEVADSIAAIHASGLFDAAWYGRRYGSLGWPPGSALVHFCLLGWRNGFQPSFYFDTVGYLARHEAVRRSGRNPLLHYIERGEAEGCRPGPHFDPEIYRDRYGIAAHVPALGHYMGNRHAHRHSPDPGFDAAWYARENADVVAGGHDLFEHYVLYGAAEGRCPSRGAAVDRDRGVIAASGLFDAAHYSAAHPDAVADGLDPLTHFCDRGWRDGACDPNPLFDTAHYLANNPDVADGGGNPLVHYVEHGEAEGRTPSSRFDPGSYRRIHGIPVGESALAHRLRALRAAAGRPCPPDEVAAIRDSGLFDLNHYLIAYPDVRASGVDPAEHFCTHGWREGRRPNAYFDPGWYARTFLDGDDAENPLLHYLRVGERRLNRPIVYFDPDWYAFRHGRPAHGTLLRQFLLARRTQTRSPVAAFDVDWYLARHGAEIGGNRDPFAHFLREAIGRDIDPGPGFDTGAYRRAHMRPAPPWRAAPGAEIRERIRREAFNPLVHHLLAEAG